MNPFANLNLPGTHLLFVEGLAGALEVELTIPKSPNWNYVAILGHPHSLQGGTMNNKVVTTMVRSYSELNIPSIRFNFRGVGKSEGIYDDGIGESADMLVIARLWKQLFPNVFVLFAGFSFGSYVTYRAATHYRNEIGQHTFLITIAPSVHKYNYTEFSMQLSPWIIVQGDEDELVDSSLVYEFAEKFTPNLPVIRFLNTGHFFHGKLIELRSRLIEVIRAQVDILDEFI